MMTDNAHLTLLTKGLLQIERDFLAVCGLASHIYTKSKGYDTSSIGTHMRHILEFLQILEAYAVSGSVDYENRQRVMVYEENAAQAAEAFVAARQSLVRILMKQGAAYSVQIKEMPGFAMKQIHVPSSFGRELLYIIEHAVHHFAMIKMITSEYGVRMPENFGVAPSTFTYNANLLKNAKQTA